MANVTISGFQAVEPYLVAYYALTLIVIGTLLNSFTFLVFLRKKFRGNQEGSTINYMRAIAIVDIIMLYGWNLDHYLSNIHGYYVGQLSLASCKIFIFINYFAPQTSAWLRVFVCLDRYMCLSRLHQTWISRPRNSLIIIGLIVAVFTLVNIHILIVTCYHSPSGLITGNTDTFQIFPLWDWVNLALYNGVPFILMLVINGGVIYQLMRLKRSTTVRNSRINHQTISITLLITTILFMILTIPPTICYGFFYSEINIIILHLLDAFMYTYHVMSFPLYLITFVDFRREVLKMFEFQGNRPRVQPLVVLSKPRE